MKWFFLTLFFALPMTAQRHRAGQAPEVGDPAPKVIAMTLTENKKIDLSRPGKITVLIFGSHT